MRQKLMRLLRDERGGTAIEYGMIAALIVMGAFLAIQNFANVSVGMWNNISTTVQTK